MNPGRTLSAQQWRAMLSVCLTVSMATLDISVANTALPTIASDLHVSAADSIWVVNAYQLAMVIALLPMAALGEIAGHRRVCLSGAVVFTLASVACGLSPSLPVLVVSRFVQGLGGAAVMAVNIAMIRHIYPPDRLGRGVGLNALVVGVCFAAGPTVASLVLLAGNWPWLFLINLPLGALALAVGWRALPATPRAAHGFDVPAAVLSAMFLGGLVLGLEEITHNAPAARVAVEWGVAVIGLTLLLRRQAGHPAPMLAVDLFRRPLFALSSLTAVCSFTTQGLAFVSLPFVLQHVLGRTQVETGFLITPWPVVVAFLAPIAGRLSDRYPAGLLGGMGLAVLSVGMALLATLPAAPSSLDIGWRMVVCGLGFGFFQSPNLNALMSSAPRHRSGGASGIIATSRLLGQTLGAALVAGCFGWSTEHGAVYALWLGTGFAAVGCVASFSRLGVAQVD